MKEFWSSFKFWVSDTFRSRKHAVKADDSFAKTVKDATHVRGGRGGLSRSGGEEVIKHAAKGHKDYQKSFKKKRP